MNIYPYERWQVEWANDAMFYASNIGMAAAVAGLGAEWLFPWFMTMVWYGANYYVHHWLPAANPEAHLDPEELEQQQFYQMLGAGDGPDAAKVAQLERQIQQLSQQVEDLDQ